MNISFIRRSFQVQVVKNFIEYRVLYLMKTETV